MISNNPITHEGETYDRFSVNLSITGSYKPDGSLDASIAMRLVPTGIIEDAVKTLDSAAIGLLRGHLAEISDPDEQAAVAAIHTALQALIDAKGL